jgi:uroporphyrinogen-III decarboxylase
MARILKAVALEKPDRTPVVLEYAGFAAYVTQTPMAEFLADPEKNLQTMIEAYRMVGGWRTAPFMLSPDMWQRFVWPYFKQVVCEVVDAGLIALLHLDSDWTRELGPAGFTLQSGCDIPTNAKLENVQAMVAAATGS